MREKGMEGEGVRKGEMGEERRGEERKKEKEKEEKEGAGTLISILFEYSGFYSAVQTQSKIQSKWKWQLVRGKQVGNDWRKTRENAGDELGRSHG